MLSWLIENALIPADVILKAAREGGIPSELADRTIRGGKLNALVWLVTLGPKRVYCAFAGLDIAGHLTPAGSLTFGALVSLPVPDQEPVTLVPIASVAHLLSVVPRTLARVRDCTLVCFLGDVGWELDGHDWDCMDAQGSVRLPVDVNAAGWPLKFKPFSN
jgi:hypothetical protein